MSVDPSENSTTVIQLSEAEQIKGKILDLQASLQKQLPNYESLLHTIHQYLGNNPDTVHLLTEEEIGVICAGLSKKTGVIIAEKAAKSGNKSLKGVTLDDLM